VRRLAPFGLVFLLAGCSHSHVQQPQASPAPPHVASISWPMYGFDAQRTHSASEFRLRPPYRRLWRYADYNTFEFPPVVGYGKLFASEMRGGFVAVDIASGRVAWRKQFDHCAAASPVIGKGVVYMAYMQPHPCNQYPRTQRGFVVAMRPNGRILWHFAAGAIESSLLLVHDTLYFGSWDGHVYAVDVRNPVHPRLRWRFAADAEVNSSPAYGYGMVYVGTDAGSVYAIDATSGAARWRATVSSREYFYATPTIAYRRVYIGNADGTLYVFDAGTGRSLWSRHAGTYIYTAAALWRGEVIIGTYDGKLVAYDALHGARRWTFVAPSMIHGAPTVIDGLVYFSSCRDCVAGSSRYVKYGPGRTFALDAATGRRVWSFFDGQYSPVVADSKRLYLVGETGIYAFAPRRRG
jgi:outer membrane protein assembly factor BamB